MDIEAKLLALTLAEKVRLVAGASVWRTAEVEHAGIPALKVSDGPNGVRGDGGVSAAAFPVGICLASTWDMDLIESLGVAIADEARSKGVHVVLGPTINIHRTPLGGRNFECYSEDPYLSGMLASAFTEGVQSRGVGACLKHYVCNDSEFERHTLSIEVDERTLREIYLRPFEIAIRRSQPWTVMAAYNRINGVYACSHDELVNGVLKQEWGFEGLVISDWFAAKETVENAEGGLDLEMPGPPRVWGEKLLTAVQNGEVTERAIDDKVRRLLRVLSWTQAAPDDARGTEQGLDLPTHRDLAYQLASDGMVLLKNEDLLPLDATQLKTLAVIGPNVNDFRIMGGGSSSLKPHYVSSPLDALADRLPGVEILTAKGCRTHKYMPEPDRRCLSPDLESSQLGLLCQFYNAGIEDEPVSERVVAKGAVMLGGLDVGDAPKALVASGYFTPRYTGAHTFGLMSTGQSRMFLADRLVVDNWTHTVPGDAYFGQSSAEKTAVVELTENKPVSIRIEFKANVENTFRVMRFGVQPPDTEDGFSAAIDIARRADAVLMIVGTNDDWETEGNDREMLNLPGLQDDLIAEVTRANPKTIVVNNSGSPVAMPWLDEVGAAVQAWFAGQEFGNALVDILLGHTNPSGRLPITFPKHIEQTPAFTNYPGEAGKVFYGERMFVGYRWYDMRTIDPLLAFGHGLSYSTFSYDRLEISSSADGGFDVSLRIENTSARAGAEVVQLYVAPRNPVVARPPQELKGFQKVWVEANAEVELSIHLDSETFAHWDTEQSRWQVAPGTFEIRLGASSRDIRLKGMVEILQ